MKTLKNTGQVTALTHDSQRRLIAYTTAAGMGAFFVSHSAEGQAVESLYYASYPVSLNVGSGSAGYNYIAIDGIDGAGTEDFNLDISSTRATLGDHVKPTGANGSGAIGTPVAGFSAFNDSSLNPSKDSYIIPWTTGETIGPSVGASPTFASSVPTYKDWLAEDSGGNFLFNNFSSTSTGILGFAFVDSGNEYFGYMDITVTASDPVAGQPSTFTSATLTGLYYNETPGASITITPAPEPSSLTLLAAGVAGLAMRQVRRRRIQ
jgi:hypothetical protein